MDHPDSLFNARRNDSLADMEEKYMQDSGTSSPRSRSGHYSFIRGPSSFDLLGQQQQTKKPKKRLLSNCGVIFLVFALLQGIATVNYMLCLFVCSHTKCIHIDSDMSTGLETGLHYNVH